MSESHDGGEQIASSRMRGTVKWFNAVKGYGFVTPEDASGDVFLHMTVLRQAGLDKIPVGSTVECELILVGLGLTQIRGDEGDPFLAGIGIGTIAIAAVWIGIRMMKDLKK